MGDKSNPIVEFNDPILDGNSGKPSNEGGGIDGKAIDPNDARNAASDGTGGSETKRKRGRPAGSRNAAAQKAAPLSVDSVSHILLSIHALLAGIAKTPELELDASESKLLAQGVVDVAKFYPVAVDPKTLAWINLTMIAGTIYGTRVYAIIAKQQKTREKPEPTIVNFATGKPN